MKNIKFNTQNFLNTPKEIEEYLKVSVEEDKTINDFFNSISNINKSKGFNLLKNKDLFNTKINLIQILLANKIKIKLIEKVIAIDSIDIDIEVVKNGYVLFLGDFDKKKVKTLKEVLEEIGIYGKSN